jgi:hypothetical protein
MRGTKASMEHLLSFAAQREIPSLCTSTLGKADAHDDEEYSHCYYGWICL